MGKKNREVLVECVGKKEGGERFPKEYTNRVIAFVGGALAVGLVLALIIEFPREAPKLTFSIILGGLVLLCIIEVVMEKLRIKKRKIYKVIL